VRILSTTLSVAVLGLGVWGCGGAGNSTNYGNPSNPTVPSAPANAVTINVVAINGAQSFSPNPATVPAGQTVVWHNVDINTHRVVLNDGELDTGNIQPGGFSLPMSLVASGPYHCTIHPVMVGTVKGQ
jgi:plastocyanin